MGPPPPPPPPPLLVPGAPLPPSKWKTENASRRNNNPVPAPPKPTRPTVDAAALQHAAARLRKTGYNEPVRGDVANLPDGRVDRPYQRVPDGDRTDGQKLDQMERYQTREQIHASPTHLGVASPLGDVHRYSDPIKQKSQPRDSPVASSNYSTIQPSTNKYAQPIYSTIQSQSTTNNTPYSNISVSNSNTDSLYSDDYVSPYASKYSSYPSSNFRSYHKDDDQFTHLTQNTQNNNTKEYGNKETVFEWSEPYLPNQKFESSEGPILNARERIHEYSTTNYVYDEPPQQPPPPPPVPQDQQRDKARTFIRNSLAEQLRDYGLTESQKQANKYQKISSSADNRLPFDVSKIVSDSFNGDQVDHLVQQMRNNLGSTSPSSSYRTIEQANLKSNVLQYPRDDAPDNAHTVYRNSTYSTTTTNRIRDTMNTNICVGCGKEITADQPGCNAMNQIFHVDCFKCAKCQKTLAGSSFYNIDEKPTCEGCYQDSLEKCSACHRSINDKLLRACGGTYHVACFVCFSCKKSLDGIPFTLDKENNVHCVPCFHDKFAPRCAMCSRPIIPVEGEKESVRVVAMDKSFHVDCYKCEDCGLQLSSKQEGHGCYPLDNHLLCKTCNGNRLRVISSA